ncbi:hypothetical protein NQ318_015006 [Aromia moschata]|uniref:Uncharacterized protein n=1 Tax=Aromia moschata TaxID=1265417 RepID=A0AAV8YYS6_9CUCU|nr:hypothetical protein NQ318_015006 [Aromia moschata]
MRFFYRIFTPMKIRPIKIVNTTLSTGGRQLQIVPVKPTSESSKPTEIEEKKPEKPEDKPKEIETELEKDGEKDNEPPKIEETEDQKNHKERLFAHLQLQSKAQVDKDKKVPDKLPVKDCVFEYEEPDQEEIKRFAEKRDREWALQKKLDETRREQDYVGHHFSKKRKKSKHSKSEFNVHKKRKLHAEIASNEEDLKLKVKITNNGHKHKHHKSSANEKTQTSEISSKEKLLQMRQVRHKHVSSEDKNVQTVPSIRLSKDSGTCTEKAATENPPPKEDFPEQKQLMKETVEETKKFSLKPSEEIAKLKIKVSEPSTKVSESAVLPKQQTEDTSTSPKAGTFLEPSSSKPGFSLKNSSEKDWTKKVPTVHLERNEQTEKQAQKTFLKTFQSYAEKYHKNEKIQQNKIESAKQANVGLAKTLDKPTQITTNNKTLERKIANLQQRCTIEPAQPDKGDKKVSFTVDKPKILTPHYPAGFTVSKIEQGVKRKSDEEMMQDKRPSLEITLINPPTTTSSTVQAISKPADKPSVKRPPPATIPLERIKKSVNLKSGISIIPKLPERCDNIGALDLSKTSKSPEGSPKSSPKLEGTNGFTATNRQLNALSRPTVSSVAEKINMSNLQMLSKVATEHPSLNKSPQTTSNKPRPAQMPSLQSLKIPLLQNPGQMKTPNLQKLPKLNEIHKFRPSNPIRNLRPNQNQNIRNIPNPSLLIRQQNQNRLNSQIANAHQSSAGEAKTTQSVSTGVQKEATTTTAAAATTVTPVKAIAEPKVQEKKEISV